MNVNVTKFKSLRFSDMGEMHCVMFPQVDGT